MENIFLFLALVLIILYLVNRFGGKKENNNPLVLEEQERMHKEYHNELDNFRLERRRKAYSELERIRDKLDQKHKTEITFEFKVVGLQNRDEVTQDFTKHIYNEERMNLEHDKSNSEIKAIVDGYHIGFVPEELTENMLPFLQRCKYKAFVLLSFTDFDPEKMKYVTEVNIKAYFFEK